MPRSCVPLDLLVALSPDVQLLFLLAVWDGLGWLLPEVPCRLEPGGTQLLSYVPYSFDCRSIPAVCGSCKPLCDHPHPSPGAGELPEALHS